MAAWTPTPEPLHLQFEVQALRFTILEKLVRGSARSTSSGFRFGASSKLLGLRLHRFGIEDSGFNVLCLVSEAFFRLRKSLIRPGASSRECPNLFQQKIFNPTPETFSPDEIRKSPNRTPETWTHGLRFRSPLGAVTLKPSNRKFNIPTCCFPFFSN